MKKYLPLILVFVTVLLAFGFYIYKSSNSKQVSGLQKCPDDYTNDDAGSAEYLAATDKWTNDFFDAHPDATLLDWSMARYQFWVDNNCTAALQRYEEVKNMTP